MGSGVVAAPRRGSRALTGLVVVVLLLAAVRVFVLVPLRIETGSMAPTLTAGEHVLAVQVTRWGGHWRRDDVVAFRPSGHGALLVKRIVALAGDRVAIRDGRLAVNGVRVREPWTDPARIDSVYFGPVRVPPGHVFVLGDDRAGSRDSRVFGAVPTSALTARVALVLWPFPPTRAGLP